MQRTNREDRLPTWSVVCTCSEPRRVVEAFVAHHISLGAEQVFLFLDDSFDVIGVDLFNSPLVTAVLCDEDHWSHRKGGRPEDHRLRQTYNAHFAARKLCTSDWLAHIDADEYIYPRNGRSVAELLSALPNEFDAARIMPAERMFIEHYPDGFLKFDGVFKLKPNPGERFGAEIYGEDLGAFYPHGFQGHEVGKSFLRCSNKSARFNIHFVRQEGKDIPHYKFEQNEIVLLHFFPISFEDWKWKYERRVYNLPYFNSMPDHAKSRYGLYLNEIEAGGESAVKALFESLCVMSRADAENLEAKGKVFFANLEATGCVAQYLPKAHKGAGGFEHLCHWSNDRSDQRFFQIGMNRSGTKEICSRFSARGFTYVHWDGGNLARDLIQAKRSNSKPFLLYGEINLVSDISITSPDLCYDGAYDIEYIANHYPEAVYIFNHRPLSEWILSRERFRGGRYMELYRVSFGLSSREEVKTHWIENWMQHKKKVENLARNGLRVVEWKINVDRPQHVFREIERVSHKATPK